jgi:hypothetical protein
MAPTTILTEADIRQYLSTEVAVGDLRVRDELAVAKSSIIGHLFAGEKGLRSLVRRDNSLRGTCGCG